MAFLFAPLFRDLSVDDSIQSSSHFLTRLLLTTETFQMEEKRGVKLPHAAWASHLPHHGEDHLPRHHVEEHGRVDCSRGNSFLLGFHSPHHSPHTHSRMRCSGLSPTCRLGQPHVDDVNTTCPCQEVVPKARDRDWSEIQRCWRLVRFFWSCSPRSLPS